MATITITNGELEITIKGNSGDFWNRDLYTEAIKYLIEQADVAAWGKDDFNALENFAAVVQTALAKAWKLNAPDANLEANSAGTISEEMVALLTENGLLNEIIEFSSEEDED